MFNSFSQSRSKTLAATRICTAHAIKSSVFVLSPPDWCDFFYQKLSHRYMQLQSWWGLWVFVYQYCSLCPQVLPARSSDSLAISFALWYVPGLAMLQSSSHGHLWLFAAQLYKYDRSKWMINIVNISQAVSVLGVSSLYTQIRCLAEKGWLCLGCVSAEPVGKALVDVQFLCMAPKRSSLFFSLTVRRVLSCTLILPSGQLSLDESLRK